MTQMTNLRQGLALIGLSVGLFALAPIVQARNIAVYARVQNVGNVHIGDVTWNSAGGAMTAVFRFRGNWGNVLDPHYDFRWFQIVKRDDNLNTAWRWDYANGQWVNPNLPYVDPPRGGWSYQYPGGRLGNQNPTNRRAGEGADDSPFYENDGPGIYWFPSFDGQYFFPDPDDPWNVARRSPRNHRDTQDPNVHVEGRFSTFEDIPGRNLTIDFQTFLVVVLHGSNTFQQGQRNFLKLVGFKWEFRQGTITNVGEVNLANEKQAIRNALANSGFGDWNALQMNDFELVPEPASLLALAIGLAGLAYRRRRAA